MSSFRYLVLATAVGVLGACALAGCSTGNEKENEPTASVESELKLTGTRYLGKILNGETRTGYYYNPPRYRSYGFDAKGGDSITIDVKSTAGSGGDAVSFITDSSYNVLALNDDASAYTYDSKVTYKVPAGTAAKSYRIVFRDYDLLDATFTVTLKITSTSSTCAYDGDTYTQGQSFPSTDGCNTCTCGAGGSVGCTKMACACDPANEPWRNYLGSPQQCITISYQCAPGWTSFQNACGCGCEQN